MQGRAARETGTRTPSPISLTICDNRQLQICVQLTALSEDDQEYMDWPYTGIH